ncbi:MAG: hypothetical protein IVW57_00565, partial [Ktedonobacterales bacterium]|nr:hypothetical protein [Ktedonobacterales bacterium]
TEVARRQRLGGLNYPAAALEALRTYQPIAVRLRFPAADGGPEQVVESVVISVLVINTPVFGGVMSMRVPDVALRDRLLDLIVIEALEPQHLRETFDGMLASLARLAETWLHRGSEPQPPTAATAGEESGFNLPGVRRYKARSVLLESDTPMDITMDGEIRAHTPALVRVAPEPVRVYVPDAMAAREMRAERGEETGREETGREETGREETGEV